MRGKLIYNSEVDAKIDYILTFFFLNLFLRANCDVKNKRQFYVC